MFVILSIWRDQAENEAFTRAVAELQKRMPKRRWKWGEGRLYALLVVGESWEEQELTIASYATDFRDALGTLVSVGARVEFEVATGGPSEGPYTVQMPVSPTTMLALGAAGACLNTTVIGVHKPLRIERDARRRRWRARI